MLVSFSLPLYLCNISLARFNVGSIRTYELTRRDADRITDRINKGLLLRQRILWRYVLSLSTTGIALIPDLPVLFDRILKKMKKNWTPIVCLPLFISFLSLPKFGFQ